MSVSEQLISWNQRWSLKNGSVCCKGCHAEQLESGRSCKFAHNAECTSRLAADEFPWIDLDMIAASCPSGEMAPNQ
ncbi:hypothetical protein EGJ27_01320 [Pseudomonas sp. v388]|uniref:hypothetical protein n=1 Tax=Pseudomonas sp. v388 TaxID=2479849 RepID=UPI000F7ADB01|nr:hypothetical protein [Pseudomonas sp. v388]RRV10293.1 hypothetical protein EGJ27_01320 [Pseudomonas sp. v388]